METTILPTLITSVITVIGFIISYILIVKQKKLAVQQHKNEWQIEKLAEILEDILDMISECEILLAGSNINKKKFEERKKKIENITICYGSNNAVKIWNYYNSLIDGGRDYEIEVDNIQIIAPLVLLLMQIKYDITDIKTSPKAWYIHYASQELLKTGFYDKSMIQINTLVDILNLPIFFKIIDNSIY